MTFILKCCFLQYNMAFIELS